LLRPEIQFQKGQLIQLHDAAQELLAQLTKIAGE